MTAKLLWIIHKDLICEYRARRVWPAMVLFGALVALVFGQQMDIAADGRQRIVGCLLWLATVLAGVPGIDRSFASEREDGCWEGVLLCPISSTTVYLSKLAVNVIALAGLQCVLIPLLTVFCDVPLLDHPWAMLAVAALGNVAVASVGTLLAAMSTDARHRGNMLMLLMLPLVVPVVIAAAEATRLTVRGDIGTPWWCWVQLLAGFAIVFTTAGMLLFDFAIEE